MRQPEERMNRMGRTSGIYTLLTAVGKYDPALGLTDLDCAGHDLEIMAEALTKGLNINIDNHRKPGTDGTITALSFARSIAEFGDMLGEEDTFILYFSGHGQNHELMFSDGGITIRSIIDYVRKLPAKQKIVILDCCYSGQASAGPVRDFSYEESLAAFSGTGIAVLASCSADGKSRLADGGYCSLYTQIIYYALTSRRKIREGKISLTDISDEIRYLMDQWNRTHPGKEQKPIYRENMIGTIYFPVEEYRPYVPQKVFYETEDFTIHHVKPLSTGTQKRLAAFVILKRDDDSIIPEITRIIVSQILYSDVYASKQSELRFHGRAADVIWCYFGHDETDLVRGNHFAYSIWAGDEKLRETYFLENRNAEIIDNIYVFWNSSYQIVKDLQETDSNDEKIIAEYRKLANMLIAHAEPFIKDLEEVENETLSFTAVKAANQAWVQEVKELFFKLSDAEAAPVKVHDWAEAILDMAGWVVDLAILIEADKDISLSGNNWLLKYSVGKYYRSLDRLMELEKNNSAGP